MGVAEWVSILGAFGLGTVLGRVVDVIWLSRVIDRREDKKWLYDKRLDAFTIVTQDLLSLGLHDRGTSNPFQQFANVSKALLLIDDDVLVKRIERFIVDLDAFMQRSSDDTPECEIEYGRLNQEARNIVCELRRMVLQGH